MSELILRDAFSVWQEDASELSYEQIPDIQIPLIGLVAAYSVTKEEKTVYAWSRQILGCTELRLNLKRLTPPFQRLDLMDDEMYDLKPKFKGCDIPLRVRFEEDAIFDGLPENQSQITVSYNFLARNVAHAAYNYAVDLKPLRLINQIALTPLEEFFPKTSQLFQGKK